MARAKSPLFRDVPPAPLSGPNLMAAPVGGLNAAAHWPPLPRSSAAHWICPADRARGIVGAERTTTMSTQKADGMNYAPRGQVKAVCAPGEFRFGVIGLDHGHIYGQCNGLIEAGGELAAVYDPDPEKVAKFRATYPTASSPPASINPLHWP